MKESNNKSIKMREYIINTLIVTEISCIILALIISSTILNLTKVQFIKFYIGILIIGFVLGTISGILNYKSFVKPINMLSEYAFKVNNNDLVYRIDIEKTGRQKAIFDWLNKAMENFAQAVRDVLVAFEKIAEDLSILKAHADQVTNSTEQVAAGIEEVAGRVNQHTENISIASSNMNLLSEKIVGLNQTAEKMEKKLQNTHELSIKGQDMVEKIKAKIEQSNLAREEANNAIRLLDNKSKEITVITDTIISISEQTNLLALNAAIEAARAGEHGRGFAVVADEIRKLAEQSANAVKQIMVLIKEIQMQTEQTVSKIEGMGRVMDEQNESVRGTSELFLDIAYSVREVTDEVNNVSRFSDEVNEKKNELINLLSDILRASEDIASAAEEIAASTQEQNASMHEINNIFSSLYNSIKELNSELKKFKV